MSRLKVFSNAGWMIGEKLINVVGLFFVNSYMAKYVGPENFGKIIFASTLFVFVQSFAWFGMQNVLFKRMSMNADGGMMLGLATQSFRTLLLLIASIVILVYLYLFGDQITFIFGIASCIASYYIVADIFSTYNNSQLTSHINTITNIIGLGLAFLARFLFTYFDMSLYWFVIPIILIPMVPYLLRKFYYFKESKLHTRYLRRKKTYIRYTFNTGGALLLSSLSIILYTQISNIFLAKLVSYTELGIYSVAMTIGGGIGIITQALITSYFSKIYEEKNEALMKRYIYQINLIVILLSLITIIGYYLIGKPIVLMLYGSNYSAALPLIPITILGTMFSSLGTICARFLMRVNGYKFLSIKMFFIAVLSIPTSYLLISHWGVLGAVTTFLLIELISCTIANYFFKKALIFKIHINTFVYGWAMLKNKLKIQISS